MADTTTSSGIGFGGLLTIVFITLKLVGTINWSWWWVLAPMWLPMAMVGIVVVAGLLTLAVTNGIKAILELLE